MNVFRVVIGIGMLVGCLHIYPQQNYKYENFGDKSMLLNGNVTGSVTDLGATYYNPSRLTTIKDPLFSINGKIFQLNTVKLKNFIEEKKELKSNNFTSLPRMVAGTFTLKFMPKSNWAYSVLSRQRLDAETSFDSGLLEKDIFSSQEGKETYRTEVNIGNKIREEWWGVSWATSLNETFKIGASLFVSQFSAQGKNEQTNSSYNPTESQVAFYKKFIEFKQESYGFFGKIGISYILPNLSLGLNVDLPYLQVYGTGGVKQDEVLTGASGYPNRYSYNDLTNLSAKRFNPLGIQIGAGFSHEKSKFHVNLGWHKGHKGYDKLKIPQLQSLTDSIPPINFREKLRDVINVGVGMEFFISKKFNGYASYSTDFSPFLETATIFDLYNQQGDDINLPTNFNHYGLGTSFSIGNVDFVLGTIFSEGKTKFDRPEDFTSLLQNESFKAQEIRYSRWRFIVGLNISVLKYNNKAIQSGEGQEKTSQ